MDLNPKVADRDNYQMKKSPGVRVERRKQIRPIRHKCGTCDKQFRNPNALRLHERDSHGIDISD